MSVRLVGDIGGTNARFALWRNGVLHEIGVLRTIDYPTPAAAIREYLTRRGVSLESLSTVCLACAGPVGGDQFEFTNNPWRLSQKDFVRELGLQRLLLINDFEAMALGMTRLEQTDRVTIQPGAGDPASPRLVIGPGTGLGVAALLPEAGGRWRALPGEGGHACLPIGSEREANLWRLLHRELGHVKAEAVISGGGLLRLYRACCELDGVMPVLNTPMAVTEAALRGEQQAVAVLEQFCVWLGRVVGDAVLTFGARGGVYLAGGVVPHFAEFFGRSGFLAALCDKGDSRAYFADVPVWLVTAPYPGLEGAGVALEQLARG